MNPSLPNWLLITPLHQFAREGNVELAALFIDHGADLHARDEDICSTPLGWAAKFGKSAMVELLLTRGGNRTFPMIRRGRRRWPGPPGAGTARSWSY
jgi:ankyrin repeat protein